MLTFFRSIALAAFLAVGLTATAYAQATVTGDRAAAGVPLFKPSGSGTVGVAHGTINLATPVVDGDIFEMVRLPRGACVFDGSIRADEMDSAPNGGQAFDADLGWAANGVEAASTAGFGNLGVWFLSEASSAVPEGGYYFRAAGSINNGPQCFSRDTTVQLEINAAATTHVGGTVAVSLLYYVP